MASEPTSTTDDARAQAAAAILAAPGEDGWNAARWVAELGLPVVNDVVDQADAAVDRLRHAGRLIDGPADLGLVYEALLHPDQRSAGAHFTPTDVAAALVERVLTDELLDQPNLRVWDPTCGGGVFLLAVLDRLISSGVPPEAALLTVRGDDLDLGAGLIAAAALSRWAHRHGLRANPEPLPPRDTLLVAPDEVFDVVIGNPPFQSQLRGPNVRTPAAAAMLRDRFGPLLRAYTDAAALFLAAGARSVRPGGRVAMIVPLSTLAARDAAPTRAELTTTCDLVGLWVAGDAVFDAAVDVCAPILRRHDDAPTSPGPAAPTRWRGRTFTTIPDLRRSGTAVSQIVDAHGAWGPHAIAALGVADPAVRAAGTLASSIAAHASFRDEYYGLADHVIDGPADVEPDDDGWPSHLAPLVTTGLIGVGTCGWGAVTTSFNRRRFQRPVVDRRSVLAAGGRAAAWVATNSTPKLVVATQTRVGEAMVDPAGRTVASTPAIVVTAPPEQLWSVAAVICSPVGSVAAVALAAGSGRSATAIRHSTTTLPNLPTPVDAAAWAAGAAALASGRRDDFVETMADAYAVPASDRGALASWWHGAAPSA